MTNRNIIFVVSTIVGLAAFTAAIQSVQVVPRSSSEAEIRELFSPN